MVQGMGLENIHQVDSGLRRAYIILVVASEECATTFTLILLVLRIDIAHADGSLHVPVLAQWKRIAIGDAASGIPAHVAVVLQRREHAEGEVDALHTVFSAQCVDTDEVSPAWDGRTSNGVRD